MSNYTIREIKSPELPKLETFLYEAIFQPNQNILLPRSVIHRPELKLYIEDFGKPCDECLVAESNGVLIGAVWTRLWSGGKKGYGYIDTHTPEITISVVKEQRGKGIGTALMQAMLQRLKAQGYTQTSLSVQKENYAVHMYQKLGFEVVIEKDDEYIMIKKFEGNV